jgi:hypothetical protein
MDEMQGKDGMLIMKTMNEKLRTPHTPDDEIALPVLKTEMMDDSILTGTRIDFLKEVILLEEQFQLEMGPFGSANRFERPNGSARSRSRSASPAEPNVRPVQGSAGGPISLNASEHG